ncbi:MAG: dephospho-CoA kinase [Nitratireductor sp.]|nr:dephospho-CoA kinase [Nitratireductor sp.]
MTILGLTGSIGMGKSTTAQMFRDLGIPVHDADATVHALYSGRAGPLIEARFPGTLKAGTVDRVELGRQALGDAQAMKDLEAIIHPLIREEEQAFLDEARKNGAELVVLDNPLLFETGSADRTDRILVVTASPEEQERRVMARPGMTGQKFRQMLARQMPDAEKRARADFVIDTGQGMDAARRAVVDLVKRIRCERAGGPVN